MSTPRTILEMRDVTRSFTQGGETIEALKKTSVAIYAGELVAVIGPSGSGKSTFLTIAGGLQSPSSGKVFINNIDITGLNNKQRSNTRFSNIGFILQASNLVPFLTIEKQLLLRDDVNGIRSNKLKSDELFNELGIERLRKKYPNELSGGERQRAAIAKVLYGEPKLILADEPTASLDSQRAFEVVELLAKETRGQERATIMVTHDERLIKFCDKVYEMHDGVLTERKKTASL
jgi:putative ABC transport system ATP-binding protein